MITEPGKTPNNGLICGLDGIKFLATPESVRAGAGRLSAEQNHKQLECKHIKLMNPAHHVSV